MTRSWACLFVTVDCPDENIWAGEVGCFRCTLSPGIRDTGTGILYTVPERYIEAIVPSPPTPEEIKRAILRYWGADHNN